jgi:threonine/homoserine/homoserine lactone efflux protein
MAGAGRGAMIAILTDPLFVAFLSFTFVFVATPGATTAIVVRNALDGGRRAGLFAALGAAAANTTHAIWTGIGGATLLAAWPGALTAIRYAGGGYLAYLGLRGLWTWWLDSAPPLALPVTPHHDARHRSALEGLTVNLLSPVIPTFYLAAVPTFIRPGWPRSAYVVLALSHVVMALVCHSSWVLGLHWMRRVFQRPGPRRALSLATAVALLWLAARVLRSA